VRRAVITVGLGFGDEAKGATCDYLCRRLKADLVVRYCGGCQAAHNVVLPDGTHHTFSQFGSGTFSGVSTYLGPDVIISPLAMVNEANHLIDIGLRNPWASLRVDERCLIATPYHQSLNRFRERNRGNECHGSCGMGVGATREHAIYYNDDALRVQDLASYSNTITKLRKIQQWVHESAGHPITDHMDSYSVYDRLHDASSKMPIVREMPRFKMAIFEGAQGILLDENHGCHPYTTWSTVTLKHAIELLRNTDIEVNVMGCIRSYMTRHGAGPLSLENPNLIGAADASNPPNEWQGRMRYAPLDLNILSHSKEVLGGKLHNVSLSCLDHIDGSIPVVDKDIEHVSSVELIKKIERVLAPVAITGRGPCYTDRCMGSLSWHSLEETIEVNDGQRFTVCNSTST
jgi:adenylosuccinate synthase